MNETTSSFLSDHYKKNFNKLVKRFSNHTGSIAGGEDVVHTAYERAIKYWNPDIREFESWFARVCYNSLNDYRKAESGYIAEEFDEDLMEGVPCEQFNREVVEQINGIIEAKDPDIAERLNLYFKYGYSITDIHNIVGGPLMTTKKLIYRFRDELKRKFNA